MERQKVKNSKLGCRTRNGGIPGGIFQPPKQQQPKQWTLQPQLLIIYRAVETYFVIASGQGCELLLQVTSSSSGCSLCYDVD